MKPIYCVANFMASQTYPVEYVIEILIFLRLKHCLPYFVLKQLKHFTFLRSSAQIWNYILYSRFSQVENFTRFNFRVFNGRDRNVT
jgi:hypothetical protein